MRTYLFLLVVAAGALGCGGATGDVGEVGDAIKHVGHLPNPKLTPGALCTKNDPNFETLRYPEQIAYCRRNIPTAEKNTIAASYGVPQGRFAAYEFDHYIPLALGGSDDATNLWPQPRDEATDKDKLEDLLFHELSAGQVTQADAVAQIRAWRPAGLAIQ